MKKILPFSLPLAVLVPLVLIGFGFLVPVVFAKESTKFYSIGKTCLGNEQLDLICSSSTHCSNGINDASDANGQTVRVSKEECEAGCTGYKSSTLKIYTSADACYGENSSDQPPPAQPNSACKSEYPYSIGAVCASTAQMDVICPVVNNIATCSGETVKFSVGPTDIQQYVNCEQAKGGCVAYNAEKGITPDNPGGTRNTGVGNVGANGPGTQSLNFSFKCDEFKVLGELVPCDNLKDFSSFFLRISLKAAGIVSVLMIIVGGYVFMRSKGNPKDIETGRNIITSAIIGLTFIAFSAVILRFIAFNLIGME